MLRLALAFGIPPGELAYRMTSSEFAEYVALEEVSPFLEERADLRIALLCSLIANVHRDTKRRKEAFTPADFMLFLPDEVKTKRKQKSLQDKIVAALNPIVRIKTGDKQRAK